MYIIRPRTIYKIFTSYKFVNSVDKIDSKILLTKNGRKKRKKNRKQLSRWCFNPALSIMTLNIINLFVPIKIQRLSNGMKK